MGMRGLEHKLQAPLFLLMFLILCGLHKGIAGAGQRIHFPSNFCQMRLFRAFGHSFAYLSLRLENQSDGHTRGRARPCLGRDAFIPMVFPTAFGPTNTFAPELNVTDSFEIARKFCTFKCSICNLHTPSQTWEWSFELKATRPIQIRSRNTLPKQLILEGRHKLYIAKVQHSRSVQPRLITTPSSECRCSEGSS